MRYNLTGSLEKKIDLLVRYVVETDSERKDFIRSELKSLMLPTEEVKKTIMKHTTEELLTNLGIPSNILGYEYAVTGVMLVIKNPKLKNKITKGLYVEIAKRHSIDITHYYRVERSIRHAIEISCARSDTEYFNSIFGNTVSSNKGKPTNSEFICRVAQVVQREME